MIPEDHEIIIASLRHRLLLLTEMTWGDFNDRLPGSFAYLLVVV